MTTVAIHQPQYLPWIPYFQKMAKADVFVYLDNVQFQRAGLQNRNQVKGPNGPTWLTVPVNARRADKIAEVRIADQRWQRRHERSIKQYYSRSPHVALYEDLVEPALSANHDLLVDLNMAITEELIEFFGIRARTVLASSLDVQGSKEELMISVCEALNGTTYLSGCGAGQYQSEKNFKKRGIRLVYHRPEVPEYSQCHMNAGFEPGMSALDAILNMGEEARSLL